MRAGNGGDMGLGRSAVGLGRGARQRLSISGRRQPRKHIARKAPHRVRIGIDPGREVDERFRRAGKTAPGGTEIAAVIKLVVFVQQFLVLARFRS